MMFMEDHIRAVMPALVARRDACDAMVCCMSAGEVMKLTRLGRFTMSGEAKGPMALLKKLRGKSGGSGGNATSGAKQMAMLRRIPKILRFIPGAAQDVRAYFLTLQYWLAGSDENVENMLRNLVDRYADGERKVLRGRFRVAPPTEYPEIGVYHPRLPGRIAEEANRLPAPAGARGQHVAVQRAAEIGRAHLAHPDLIARTVFASACLDRHDHEACGAGADRKDRRHGLGQRFGPACGEAGDDLRFGLGLGLYKKLGIDLERGGDAVHPAQRQRTHARFKAADCLRGSGRRATRSDIGQGKALLTADIADAVDH
jgi:hypothetical protein